MVLLQWIIVLCSLINVSTAQFLFSGGSASGSGVPCPVGEFRCFAGDCIPLSQLCDGKDDCGDGYDEFVCFLRGDCRPDEFRCPAGTNECISLSALCDGVTDCLGGPDENNCPSPPPDSPCESAQFECRLSQTCVPLARRCNGAADCLYSEDEQNCIPPIVTTPPGPPIVAAVGENITLTCEANGSPAPFITWRKNLQSLPLDMRYVVSSKNGVGTLTVQDATLLDAGEYTCEVVSKLYGDFLALPGTNVTVVDPMPFTCQDHQGTPYPEGQFYYSVDTFTSGEANQAAADIIFVVDESGSMFMEHAWIRKEVYVLESQLQERGVGVGERENLYALVGFARADLSAISGILISNLTRPDEFVNASFDLRTSGLIEDGYSGIDFALRNVQPRPGTARQLILVTDEDRGILRSDLTRDVIEQQLKDEGFVLNVIVNQGFLADSADNSSLALGLTGNGTAYIVDNSSDSFTAVEGGEPITFSFFEFGDTLEDYVELAFRLGGAAWDLNQLREQGDFARAFTNAFTAVKVEEVMNVFRVCFACFCEANEAKDEIIGPCIGSVGIEISDCVGIPAILTAKVTPSQTLTPIGLSVTFRCLAHSTSPTSAFQYMWEYPPQSGSNDIAIDGDSLTVSSVGQDSSGAYKCLVTDTLTGAMASANGTLDIDTRCTLDDGTVLLLSEVRAVLTVPLSNLSRAADIVLVVDESSSMLTEHEWIAGMTQDLDEALRVVNIGVKPRNLFGVVGFGADCLSENFTFGRVIANSANDVFSFSTLIDEYTAALGTSGRLEDGYSGIKTAVEGYSFRNTAKQFILITDEDRDPVDRILTRVAVQQMLEEAGVVLNVAVSEEFEGDDLRALGIDGTGSAYVYDPSASSLFRVVKGAGMSVLDSGHGDTNVDYTQLALELGGAAWDLSRLREGGEVAEAFTNAFVYVKVLEIRAQMEQCFNCTCTFDGPVCNLLPSANFSQCVPVIGIPSPGVSPLGLTVDPEFAIVSPNESITFLCQANNTAKFAWTFNGGLLPSNAFVTSVEVESTELRVDTATEANAGVYACLAHAPSEAFSAAAVVQVEFYDPDLDLSLQLQPLEVFAMSGDNVTFNCTTATDPVTIQWLFNYSSELPSNVLLIASSPTESLLIIDGAAEGNIGTYTCVVTSEDRNITDEDTACLVDVATAPPVGYPEIFPDVPVTVIEGESEERLLVCNVTCRVVCSGTDCFCPGVELQWRRSDGEPLSARITTETLTGNVGDEEGLSSFLSIDTAALDDDGRYLCVVELLDEGRNTTAESFIMVTEAVLPFMVTIKDPEQGGSLNQSVLPQGGVGSILCEGGKDSTQVYWSSEGELVPVQQEAASGSGMMSGNGGLGPTDPWMLPLSSRIQNVVAVELSTARTLLVFLRAEESNAGVFECYAESQEGDNASALVQVDVKFIPSPSPSISPTSPLPTPISMTPSPFPSSCLSSLSIVPMPTQAPPPFEVTFPMDTLELVMGETGSITCMANHPVATFVWLFNFNSNLPSNVVVCSTEKQSVLTINGMQQNNTGLYQCSAVSAWTQNVMTEIVSVVFKEVLTIEVTPAGELTVNKTESVELSCTLSCGCSGTNLTWVRSDGSPLHSQAQISLSDSKRTVFLTFASVPREADGVYVCVATNNKLGSATEEVELRVIAPDDITTTAVPIPSLGVSPTPSSTPAPPQTPTPPLDLNAVIITPDSIELPEGASTVFACVAGSPVPFFLWQFNLNLLPVGTEVQPISMTMSQLEITNVTKEHAGSYFCTVQLNGTNTTALATLVFKEALRIQIIPESPVQAILGEALRLECNVDCPCGGEIDLEWTKIGSELPSNSIISKSDSKRTVYLDFNSVTAEAAGEYECVASREAGDSVRQTVMLEVSA